MRLEYSYNQYVLILAIFGSIYSNKLWSHVQERKLHTRNSTQGNDHHPSKTTK